MTLRSTAASTLALAAALLAFAGPVLAQSPAQSGPSYLPYDARRGVFSFAAGLEASLPAVVQVTTLGQSRGPSSDADDPKPYASGSGVIVDAAQGILITNNHVVENGRKFTVDLTDGRLFDAVLVGADKATDIAVLKIVPDGRPLNLKQVQTVDSDTLRTGDLACPFPEEANRILIDRGSALLFAPTPGARRNLLREGAPARSVEVTGNTAVDALRWAASRPHRFRAPALRGLGPAPLAVVTLHRRESWGRPMAGIFRAILDAARLLPDLLWIYPVHPNPAVRGPARRILRHPRIRLVPPLDYMDFVHLMARARLIVTDSGGIQEEAPSLGVPVVVARKKTERPEALGRGSTLAGVSRPALTRAILRCARRPAAAPKAGNPFGDGRASERIARALLRWARSRKR